MQWDETGLRIPLSFGQNMLENFIYIYIYYIILYFLMSWTRGSTISDYPPARII